MSNNQIFINLMVPEEQKMRIRTRLPEADVFFAQDFDSTEGKQTFSNCEVVFGNPPLTWIEESHKLRWIQLESAGLDPFQEVIREGKIKFSNLQHFFSQPVAETALAGILALYRNIHVLMQAQQEKKWEKDDIRSRCETVKDKHILILGPGSIGRKIHDLLLPMGGSIKMFGSRKDLSAPLDELDDLLRSADIFIGCLPESESTIQLLTQARLNLLPDQAIVVNVGRGSLLDEKALVQMLRKNRLRGAFLDVTQEEPIPADSDLWRVPNLLLGQHAAGGMPDELGRKIDFFIDNYRRFKTGTPKNLLGKEA